METDELNAVHKVSSKQSQRLPHSIIQSFESEVKVNDEMRVAVYGQRCH